MSRACSQPLDLALTLARHRWVRVNYRNGERYEGTLCRPDVVKDCWQVRGIEGLHCQFLTDEIKQVVYGQYITIYVNA
jgi:hypothetical protein